MTAGETRVAQLAVAILDGTPVDWPAAESAADNADQPLLRWLKIVAAVADVHRAAEDAAPLGAAADGSPQRWGHLDLLEPIGRGTFGDVYRAWDTRLDREVALKLLDAAGASPSSSVIHEGRLLARVRHPNVVTIYGAEQIGPRIGLWMEFVRGRTLRHIMDAGKVFSGPEAVHIGIDLCRAVAAVHGAGLLHRDIKAANVMLADDGRAVLMDFGTGRELDDNSSDVAGTPLYLAPEVLAGHDATVRSDIYSLGVLLYYLVTGSYPVRGKTVSDLRLAHQRSERIHIRTAPGGSDLSPKLARIVERALDPRPEGRYASAEALAADLAALQRRPVLVRLSYAIAAATALLLVAGLAWEAVGRRVGSSRTPGVWLAGLTGGASTASPTASPVIAVLPFKNLSVESGSEYFVDGLTIEITRNLAVIQGLQVRSQLSSFDFRDKPRDIGDVGRRLRVNLVVEGSVWRSGNTLRVNAQLVQVAGDVVLWSETFDRELKDVFAIQDEISLAIVNRLRLTLGRGQRRYDTSAEAYELYLKGSALLAHRGRDSLEKAAAMFTQVLVKDSEYPPAHAGLAIAYATMSLLPQAPGGHPIIPVETADAIIRPNAVRALALDPNLADAEAAMGWVHVRDLDWSGAEKAFQRAIALNPSLTHAYTSYSLSTLRPLGKQEDALRLLRVALENDPHSLDVQREIGFAQYEMKRYEDAIHTLQTLRAVEPDFPFADLYLARALVSAGRPAEALALFERIDRLSGRPRRLPDLALAFIALGRRAEAEELAVEHADGGPAAQATIHAALGDKDRAFDALERLAVVDPLSLPRRLVRPEMAVLRGDPRLVSLRERFRLPPQ